MLRERGLDPARRGVGQVGLTTLVSLPGPHDEVELTAPALVKLLGDGSSKEEIAAALAGILAEKWRANGPRHPHSGENHESSLKIQ